MGRLETSYAGGVSRSFVDTCLFATDDGLVEIDESCEMICACTDVSEADEEKEEKGFGRTKLRLEDEDS